MPDPHKLPRSPLKVALIAFGVTVLIGLIAGIVGVVIINPGGNMEKRGEMVGQGVATLGFFVAVAAYFIQRKRTGG